MKDHQIFENVTAELHRYLFPKSLVKQNQKIVGRSGVARQIDILVEDIVGICPLKIVIDCKHYKTKVDINTVDEVFGLVDDVRASLGMIVCNAGFTDGAMKRAKEKGMMLCSILDLQNKDFSIKPKFPVVFETSEPIFEIKILPERLEAALPLDSINVFLKNMETLEMMNIHQIFLNDAKEGKIKIPRDGCIDLNPNTWRLILSGNEVAFQTTHIKYRFTTKYQLGMVPAIQGKGMLDIQTKFLTFRELFLEQIDIGTVWNSWEEFKRAEDIPVTPLFWIQSMAVE